MTKTNTDDGYEVKAGALLERIDSLRRERQPVGAREWMLLAKALQERLADDLEQVTEDEDAVDTICDLCYAIDGLHHDATIEEAGGEADPSPETTQGGDR